MIVKEASLLDVEMILDPAVSSLARSFYSEAIKISLKEVLPEKFLDPKWLEERSQDLIRKKIYSLLPFVKQIARGANISFFCIFKYRANGFKFFFELVSHWLIPGKRLDVVLLYAVDFRLPLLGEDVLTFCEVIVRVENPSDFDQISRNFPLLEEEARLGVGSDYYARKILEVKGVSVDHKTSLIQQRIASFVARMPMMFSSDVFSEMQHFLVLCHDDFKAERSVLHLGRLVCVHYLFRRQLEKLVKGDPTRRRVLIKVFKTVVNFPAGRKSVLAVMVGLNFLRDKEIFEQRHILKAVQEYVPCAEAIEQTFFSNRKGSKNIFTTYLEVEKNDGTEFTAEELRTLKTELPNDLQNHIGQLMLPVFMPRNEEDIMRNILSLSHQLKYLKDIPQVSISFDEQTDRNLFFTVIFVRILKGEEKPIQEKMRGADTFLRYLHDRTRIIGHLRKKYPKEANVFRVKFPKESFLRGDHSIDLYKARQVVVNELSRTLGDFRDFNGGMISKQKELLNDVKALLSAEAIKYSDIILENFFYSLTPVIMRTVLEPQAFKTLFTLLVEQQEKGIPPSQKFSLLWKYELDFSCVVMSARNRSILDELSRSINKIHQVGSDLVQGYLKTPERVYMGYIYRTNDVLKQAQFHAIVDSLTETGRVQLI